MLCSKKESNGVEPLVGQDLLQYQAENGQNEKKAKKTEKKSKF